MATKKLKVVAAPKRRRGRPAGSGNKQRLTKGMIKRLVDAKASAGQVDEAAAEHEAPAVTAADLITDIRPHIKGIDAVISGCVAAGVDPYLVVKFQTDSTSLFENMLLALARAP